LQICDLNAWVWHACCKYCLDCDLNLCRLFRWESNSNILVNFIMCSRLVWLCVLKYQINFLWCNYICLQVFKPYAKMWLTPLLELILCKEFMEKCGNGINYFVNDVMVTALSWHSVAIPEVIIICLTSYFNWGNQHLLIAMC